MVIKNETNFNNIKMSHWTSVKKSLKTLLKENGALCLYALVTNIKFYNIGIGTLSYSLSENNR